MVSPSIPEYFCDKEIFLTGATGFIGKVLIEKLLRSCPGVKKIHLLIRKRKDLTAADRVKQLMDNELFDLIRQTSPETLKKVVAVSGDVSELKLGLSEEDRASLRNVNVAYHVAASVRFDDPLKKATLMNTRGTREVMELMLEMPRLEVGVHVSTTYCNTDKHVIEERIYRDHGDWKEAIRVAENFEDDYKLACLMPLVKKDMRNTYVYTKHLAENVAEDYSDKLPLVLYRPGVVISMWKDPIAGWVDNVNGPVGITLAVGKGLLRVMKVNPDTIVDNFPVDIVVKGLIISTWLKGIKSPNLEKMPVYNCSVQGNYEVTQRGLYDVSLEMLAKTPYNEALWHPYCYFTDNDLIFRVLFFITNVIPLMFVDTLLKISGKKAFLMKVIRKTYVAIDAVSYFVEKNWDFKCEKNWALNNVLSEVDRKNFDFSVKEVDLEDFMRNARLGTSKYLLKEKIHIPSALQSYNRLKMLNTLVKCILYGAVVYYIVFSKYVQGKVMSLF